MSSKTPMSEIEVDRSGPRPKVRNILHGNNRWNVEGLKAARRDTDSDIFVCEISGEELYYVQDDGRKVNLRTHGVCCECERLVGVNSINNHGADRARWPVVYVGAHCIECWPRKK
jgi:hypothetical protein